MAPAERVPQKALIRMRSFDKQLAMKTLSTMSPGCDGVESMSKCCFPVVVYETTGYKRPDFNSGLQLDPNTSTIPLSFRDDSTPLRVTLPPSPLLDLPETIRRLIYAHAVTYPDPIPIRLHTATIAQKTDTGEAYAIARQRWFFIPPLLRTCCEVERDAAPIFYACNAFQAELTDAGSEALYAWLAGTERAYLALVPKLVLSFNSLSYFDLDRLLQVDGSGRMGFGTNALVRAITSSGIGAARFSILLPRHLHKPDGDPFGMDAVGLGKLGEQWAAELRWHLNHEEFDDETEDIGMDGQGYVDVSGETE